MAEVSESWFGSVGSHVALKFCEDVRLPVDLDKITGAPRQFRYGIKLGKTPL